MKSIVHAGVSVAVALCASAFPAAAQTVFPLPQGVLSLTASASVEVTKDLLAVTFSTTREGPDANAVQDQLKQAQSAALAEAKKVARPGQLDVQTGNFSLYPRYANGARPAPARPGIVGWQGTAEIVVEGRDLAAIGALTGRITTMTIARVAYRLSREASSRVEGDVAAEAITSFRGKAAAYAKQFGYGGVAIREVNVQTTEPPGPPVPTMRMQASAAPGSEALSVEPGRATVTATVSGSVQMQ